ncbi:glycosyltransferase family 1 protein [Streptomyces sp. A7024]|uniref:D-inositol 3-phosphate glycosyltransferase n=1 Tax=Streptomyces coryli TaxID=1128680 RepID=A0A6G4UEL5_9ACTN|nr:glycosyltransferase [Streptomyces coryli]NGN70286.1 glycosyltransferase family 1 protein [Streptomyces coryli]
MRIAMVSEHASPLAALGGPDAGGQNVYVARLAAALAARGHEVTVHTRRDSPHLPERVRTPAGVVVEHVPAGPAQQVPKDHLLDYMPYFGRHLAHRWHAEPPDVAHAHYWMSGMASLIGAHDEPVPVVQTFHVLGTVKRRHQGRADSSPYERVQVEKRIGRSAARTIATCGDEAVELTRLGVPAAQVAVVPCGVDVEAFRPGAPARGPVRQQRHRLLAVGRLVRRKGFDEAIRALPAIPNTELVIAGGPPQKLVDTDPEAERLRALARGLGVGDRVRFAGGVSHERMPNLIRSADAVVCTPRYEPFGMVPLEAMACGVPVLATAVGGQPDTVADEETGLLLPPDDPDMIASAARRLLARPTLRRRFGAAGRKRVLSRFTWSRVTDGVEQVYTQVSTSARIRTGAAS